MRPRLMFTPIQATLQAILTDTLATDEVNAYETRLATELTERTLPGYIMPLSIPTSDKPLDLSKLAVE
jgi:hypothetical protein